MQKIQKHFRKMFAGIATITLSDDESTILGVASREGEDVSNYCSVDLLNFND